MRFRTFRIWLTRGHYRLLYTLSALLLPAVCKAQSQVEVKPNPAPESEQFVLVMYGTPFPEESIDPNAPVDTVNIQTYSEDMPEFPGGTLALMQYINDNLKFPESCKQKGIQGRVLVSFTVEKDGSLSNIEIAKSVDKELDAEALRLAKSMPKWKPGSTNGVTVRVKYIIPIHFKIN